MPLPDTSTVTLSGTGLATTIGTPSLVRGGLATCSGMSITAR